MSRPLIRLLEDLEGRLAAWGAPVVRAFRPGAPPERVREVLGAEGLAADEELIEWFAWHDGAMEPPTPYRGVLDRPEAVLLDQWYVISLAEAVELRRWHRQEAANVGEPDPLMPPSWFPILRCTGVPFMCLQTDRDQDGAAPLYIVDWPGGQPGVDPRPQFESLSALIELMIRAFDSGRVGRDVHDPRLPAVGNAGLADDELRRLLVW